MFQALTPHRTVLLIVALFLRASRSAFFSLNADARQFTSWLRDWLCYFPSISRKQARQRQPAPLNCKLICRCYIQRVIRFLFRSKAFIWDLIRQFQIFALLRHSLPLTRALIYRRKESFVNLYSRVHQLRTFYFRSFAFQFILWLTTSATK